MNDASFLLSFLHKFVQGKLSIFRKKIQNSHFGEEKLIKWMNIAISNFIAAVRSKNKHPF